VTSNIQIISDRQARINAYEEELNALRSKWTETDEAVMPSVAEDRTCPTCGQELPEGAINEKHKALLNSFNKEKDASLKKIEERGLWLKGTCKDLKDGINSLMEDIKTAKDIISKNEKILSESQDIKIIPVQMEYPQQEQIKELEDQLSEVKPVDTKDLQSQKSILTGRGNTLRQQLQQKDLIDKIKLRISELRATEQDLSQQLADLEGMDFLADRLDKVKINIIEESLNSRFWMVRFKMFNTLINGASEPCCDILINGVPFSDANNAAKINAGVDIINSLASHFDCTAPIFIDNAEAVNEIIPTNSQLIRLVVTSDPQLIIK
jgi:DNA repair exonuclease SbcCD ATPase subunit